jgi:hypothetical protein
LTVIDCIQVGVGIARGAGGVWVAANAIEGFIVALEAVIVAIHEMGVG